MRVVVVDIPSGPPPSHGIITHKSIYTSPEQWEQNRMFGSGKSEPSLICSSSSLLCLLPLKALGSRESQTPDDDNGQDVFETFT